MDFTVEQEKILLDALGHYVDELEKQRQHLRLNQYGSKEELLRRINIANDLIISLPAAELAAAKEYRDIELSLGRTESARLAQIDIDEMEGKLNG